MSAASRLTIYCVRERNGISSFSIFLLLLLFLFRAARCSVYPSPSRSPQPLCNDSCAFTLALCLMTRRHRGRTFLLTDSIQHRIAVSCPCSFSLSLYNEMRACSYIGTIAATLIRATYFPNNYCSLRLFFKSTYGYIVLCILLYKRMILRRAT